MQNLSNDVDLFQFITKELIYFNKLSYIIEQYKKQGSLEIINTTDFNGRNIVHHICSSKDVQKKFLEFLHSHGADFKKKDNSGQTPLHFLCSNPNFNKELFDTYLPLADDINILSVTDNENQTPFAILCQYVTRSSIDLFTFEYVAKLTSKTIKKNRKNSFKEIESILKEGITEVKYIKVLNENGWPIEYNNSEGETAFLASCKYCNQEIIKYYISLGSDIKHKDKRWRTALHYYVQNSNISLETIKYFISKGCFTLFSSKPVYII